MAGLRIAGVPLAMSAKREEFQRQLITNCTVRVVARDARDPNRRFVIEWFIAKRIADTTD
jgi:hypothetical protein